MTESEKNAIVASALIVVVSTVLFAYSARKARKQNEQLEAKNAILETALTNVQK